MSRLPAIPASALCLALATAACDIQFVGPGRDSAAGFAAQLTLVDTGGPARLDLDATLVPGTDAEGNPRVVTADTITVLGAPLAPTLLGAGSRRYVASYPLSDSLPPPVVTIAPPPVAGVPRPDSLVIVLPRARGSHEIAVSTGTDIPLSLWWSSAPAPGSSVTWTVLASKDPALLRMAGYGVPPEPLVLSPSWTAAYSVGDSIPLSMSASVDLTVAAGQGATGYHASGSGHALLRWMVRLTQTP